MTDFSPREIVSELDRFIIGQGDAKRAVAIALRNRWRRLQLDEKLREEVLPKNILMIGPTGVGKTEISRRLAKLAGAPFIKVEATKFTEVGYVGREPGETAGNLGLAYAGGADHEDVLGQHLFAQLLVELQPSPAIAQRDRDRALGIGLPDDEAVELGDDFARREVGHGSLTVRQARPQRAANRPA